MRLFTLSDDLKKITAKPTMEKPIQPRQMWLYGNPGLWIEYMEDKKKYEDHTQNLPSYVAIGFDKSDVGRDIPESEIRWQHQFLHQTNEGKTEWANCSEEHFNWTNRGRRIVAYKSSLPKEQGGYDENCGLSKEEWELEKVVDQIRSVPTLEAIGILRKLQPPVEGENEQGQGSGWDSLRYLLNIAEEKPKSQLKSVLDLTHDKNRVTVRQHLEQLWANRKSPSSPEGKEAIEFGDFIAKNNYITTTLPHESPQLWQELEYPEEGKENVNPEITTEQLYQLFKIQGNGH